MKYRFDKNSLEFVEAKLKWKDLIIRVVGIFIIAIFMFSWTTIFDRKKLNESEIMVIVTEHNKFSDEKLIKMIGEMNFEFPHIVYAQSLLETCNFTSPIFMENNNLFGMKVATQRITLNHGENNDHAVFNSWIDSVNDYGFYCATYLSRLKNEEDYFSYLGQYYAEDKEYVNKLKQIIKDKDLRNLFKR